MFKFLKDVVSGSGSGLKDLPYNIGDPYSTAWGSWTHYRGTSKDDGSQVSIFALSGSNSQDRHLAAGRNGVKRLRNLRHPNILSFLHSTEAETFEGNSQKHTIYIVTEPVMPLSEKVKELDLTGIQRDEYYAWGLHQISKAVSFLNNDHKLVHGNVCVSSVVVTQTLDWKLHAFDLLSEFDANNESANVPMLQYEWLVGSQYKPTELAKSEWSTIRKSPPWSIDSWGLGCLIYELFTGVKLDKTEELRNTAFIPKSLLPDYQRLLSSMPSRRMNPSKLIDTSEFFQNKLVETIQFMEILNLKDSVEKDSFFRKLPNVAEQLPREIVLKKLLPVLASSLEFGSAAAPALTVLLKMGSLLPPDQFNLKVLPTIVKLFASNDRAIRVSLLQHVDQFGDSLSNQIVDEQVFPNVAAGFADTSAFLRELTLKSMLVLGPKLSQRTLSGSLLKYLSKLQVDEEPAIRTNTTILLGNIASYMNDGTRKRVLINAFTVRALRDTFPPARSAGLMALMLTSSYYDMTEITTRIVPNVFVLTIDPDSDVSTKAIQAMEQFFTLVKQYHDKVHDKLTEADTGGTEASATGGVQSNAGLLGWAMSSLTQKGKTSENHTAPISSSSLPTPATTNPTSVVEVPSGVGRTGSTSSFEQVAPPSPTKSMDGWGDAEENLLEAGGAGEEDGWDDVDPFEDSKSASLSTLQAAQKRPISSQPKSVSSSRVAQTKPAKETEEDLWGSVAASVPVPKPIKKIPNPKPVLSSTTTSAAPKLEDDLWGSIAAPPPKSKAKPLKPGVSSESETDDSDPWAAIAAPAPNTRAKPLALGRGRGAKPSQPKLGAQKIGRTGSGSSSGF